MEQSPSETDSRSPSPIPLLFLKPKAYCRVYKNPPLDAT